MWMQLMKRGFAFVHSYNAWLNVSTSILKFYKFQNEVGIDMKQEMMVLQHSSVRKPLHWHVINFQVP